jgi:hypothetical protein
MKMIGEVLTVWKKVFREKKYIFLVLVFGFVFYLLNGFILNISNIKTFYLLFGFFGSMKHFFLLSFNFASLITTLSMIGIIFLSLLVGMMLSILVYRFKLMQKGEVGKVGLFGSIGLFLGVAAPGCAACGVGLVSLLGLTSALLVLPYDGQEIIFLAVGIVAYSLLSLSRKLYNPVCELKSMKNSKIKNKMGQNIKNSQIMKDVKKGSIHPRSLKFTQMKGGKN